MGQNRRQRRLRFDQGCFGRRTADARGAADVTLHSIRRLGNRLFWRETQIKRLREGRNYDLLEPTEWASLGLDSRPLDLIYHDKDMATACDSPVATLPVPIAVPMTAPIAGVPIATSVDSSCTVPMHNGPIVPPA